MILDSSGCGETRSGLVCLHSVEDGHLLREFSAGAAITQLQWTQQSEDRSVIISRVVPRILARGVSCSSKRYRP